MPEDLACLRWVFGSHDDFSVVVNIYVGFDSNLKLIIYCERTDYDYPAFNCATWAELSRHEAYRLARRLKVSLDEVPGEICECMSDWHEMHCPLPSDAVDCFGEIVDCLVAEGCHFKIHRHAGRWGMIPC